MGGVKLGYFEASGRFFLVSGFGIDLPHNG